MGKITGAEKPDGLPEKVRLLYNAVFQLFVEGTDLADITVSGITGKAGIGKGTAYDYFDSKEDLVACALLYVMTQMTEKLLKKLETKENFNEQMACLLDWVEESFFERNCLIRFLHLLTDSSSIGQLLRQKMDVKEIEQYLPMTLFQRLFEKTARDGEVRADISLEYMAYTVYSRLAGYVTFLYIENPENEKRGKMRMCVYQGIMKEFAVEG